MKITNQQRINELAWEIVDAYFPLNNFEELEDALEALLGLLNKLKQDIRERPKCTS